MCFNYLDVNAFSFVDDIRHTVSSKQKVLTGTKNLKVLITYCCLCEQGSIFGLIFVAYSSLFCVCSSCLTKIKINVN